MPNAVHSVLRQTYANIEIIVVNDGSTDNTHEILRSFEDQVRVLQQQNRGPSAARNTGLAHARGSLIAFLDSDDVWLPDKIERQVRLLTEVGHRVPCCVCNARLTHIRYGCGTSFDMARMRGTVQTGLWRNPSDVLAATFLLFNQVAMIRRDVLEAVGGFREDLWLLEDYDLAIRLSLSGPWGIIREPLVIKHDDTAGSLSAAAESEPLRILRTKETVLNAILSCSKPSARARRSLTYALLRVKMDIYAHAMANRTQKLTSGLGRFLLTAFHFRDAVWRRSPWWPTLDVVPVGAAVQG
jgi:glycosyltransferase involved in cell wall biosynthesis